MKRLALMFLALSLLSSGCRKPTTTTAPTSGDLIWSDEFDGAAGSPPAPTRWRYEVGTDWGNQQLEYDTNRPSNASLDGAGHLLITARREDYLGRAYTSARLNTLGQFTQAYGRFEARIKLPIGQGIWPAFWLLGANIDQVGWPGCGEIDILEYRGQQPATIWGSVHGPGYSGGNAITTSYSLPAGTFNDDYHVFSVEWSPNRIVWKVDGNLYRTVTPASLPGNGTWVFDHPFSIILNVAVGGNYVGPPDATTPFPQSMIVDWVRVYRLPA
jgi:beta-glucanase (GH16 family)